MSEFDRTEGPDDQGPVGASGDEPREKVEGYERVEDVPLGKATTASPGDSSGSDKPVKKSNERKRLSGLVGGFKNPATRPRFIIWTGVAVFALAAVMIVALGVTSTRWFCAEGCHKVQDDSIIAYEHSPHKNISCMACHMPAGADPITFILHKAEALGELYLTVTDNFELPLNGHSHVSLTMASAQCTQCHALDTRKVTPSAGILIDHEVHASKGVECTYCHNRVAHVEDFELTLNDPSTGERNKPHANFSSMTACFRCHVQGDVKAAVASLTAPGECSACHTPGFELKPASHKEADFFPAKHGELANAEAERVAEALAEVGGAGEGEEHSSLKLPSIGTDKAYASSGGETLGTQLPAVETINECYTCHAEKFCTDCHKAPVPHPADFIQAHGEWGQKDPKSCEMCHGPVDRFCDDCHHGSAINWTVDTSRSWIQQHDDAVGKTGAKACFECHDPTYCARCHVRGGKL